MQEPGPKKICLFGPQGSGKGTQAEKICEYLGVPQISPGIIFRQAVAEGSELGKQVEGIINSGQLVDNEITNSLVEKRLLQEDCIDGFILDGYPRNMQQAKALDSFSSLSHVVVIDIPDEESIRRISRRRSCVPCGITYHLDYKPPTGEGVCDGCGKELTHRDDDKPDAIKERLYIYHTETEPLFERYEERGILHRVDGTGTIEEVWQRTQNCFF